MNRDQFPPVRPPGNKYDTIQVLRFIAAFMVILLHATFYTSERLQPGFPLYYQGSNGVRLFFVISGFVMIISSQNLKNRTGGWKIFATRRIIRIVPVYWIITTFKLLVLLFASSLVYHARIDAVYIVKSYFFIPAKNVDGELNPLLGVGWTLNFEMFFYLLFTIALALRANAIVLLSIIFIPLSVLSVYKTADWPDTGFYANPAVLDFLYGMIAAQLILHGKKIPQIAAIPLVVAGLVYLFLPGMEVLLGAYAQNKILIGVMAFLIVYSAASIESLRDLHMPRWLIYLGGASYSLYLIHPIVAPLAPAILQSLHLPWTWLSVALGVVIAVAAGTVFYKFCEQPLTQFLSKWTHQRNLI